MGRIDFSGLDTLIITGAITLCLLALGAIGGVMYLLYRGVLAVIA